MRNVFKQICIIIMLAIPLCNSHTSSALSTTERYLMSAVGIGITYGIGRIGAWASMWQTKQQFAKEINTFTNFYGSYEGAQETLQHIILVRHSSECFDTRYNAYQLLWYKDQLDSYLTSLKFWRIATIGSSDWKAINVLIDRLQSLRRLVVTNYLYIDELRAFTYVQQRYA